MIALFYIMKGGIFLIDWKRKLTSRKLWLAIAGFVAGVVALFSGTGNVEGVIMALGSVVAYIFGEGLSDAERKE